MKLKLFIIWCLVLGTLFSGVALAHIEGAFWMPGDPIVPCTNDCTQCELLHLVRHVVDFILIAAAPIIATFFFVVAGVYIMLGGANPGMLATGKRIFKDTFIGILIIMLAWLITNTIIQTLAEPAVTFQGRCVNGVCVAGNTELGPCSADSQCDLRYELSNWWQFSCPASWQ